MLTDVCIAAETTQQQRSTPEAPADGEEATDVSPDIEQEATQQHLNPLSPAHGAPTDLALREQDEPASTEQHVNPLSLGRWTSEQYVNPLSPKGVALTDVLANSVDSIDQDSPLAKQHNNPLSPQHRTQNAGREGQDANTGDTSSPTIEAQAASQQHMNPMMQEAQAASQQHMNPMMQEAQSAVGTHQV